MKVCVRSVLVGQHALSHGTGGGVALRRVVVNVGGLISKGHVRPRVGDRRRVQQALEFGVLRVEVGG